jgi:predicted small lipoprotein YifL
MLKTPYGGTKMKKLAILAAIALLASSCGIKGTLDKPPEAKYKRTYPST